ncbi:Rieske (2Fe-2S) protein [Pseudomonas moorei]|uniref:Rieske (2Fe-2S) protein n=1 Tax=Pseudomonas moorei TaxID=395599 RepID=UPI00200D9BE9|nr:Rieske 2Fe-2S domain-containing protein [Pseudomonas moorei]
MTQRNITVPAGQLPPLGGCRLITEQCKNVALFNVDGQFYAINDCCPHQGASLSNGRIEGHVIRCRAHGLRFDLANGQSPNPSRLEVTRYPTEHLDDQTLIIVHQEIAT